MSERNQKAASDHLRLAYADPPYPGKAHLYPENTEVDHVALMERLQQYDGWALSTDEAALRYVLSICPPDVRVLAWCRRNAAPHKPQPYAAWEPVILKVARKDGVAVRSYYEGLVPAGRGAPRRFIGQKPPDFCEWVIRCLGALPDDSLDDLFPGTGAMMMAWEKFVAQMPLVPIKRRRGGIPYWNEMRRWNTPLDGLASKPAKERGKEWGRNHSRRTAEVRHAD